MSFPAFRNPRGPSFRSSRFGARKIADAFGDKFGNGVMVTWRWGRFPVFSCFFFVWVFFLFVFFFCLFVWVFFLFVFSFCLFVWVFFLFVFLGCFFSLGVFFCLFGCCFSLGVVLCFQGTISWCLCVWVLFCVWFGGFFGVLFFFRIVEVQQRGCF